MLNKLINLVKKINLPLVLFVSFSIKAMLVPFDFASSSVLAILATTYSFCRYIAIKEPQKRPDRVKTDVDKLMEDMKEIKGALTKSSIKQATKSKKYF